MPQMKHSRSARIRGMVRKRRRKRELHRESLKRERAKKSKPKGPDDPLSQL